MKVLACIGACKVSDALNRIQGTAAMCTEGHVYSSDTKQRKWQLDSTVLSAASSPTQAYSTV